MNTSHVLVKVFREEFSVEVMLELRPRRFKGMSQDKKREKAF